MRVNCLVVVMVALACVAAAMPTEHRHRERHHAVHKQQHEVNPVLADKLHERMAAKSEDFNKLPQLKQQEVIQALHAILLRRATSAGKGLDLNITVGALPCWICEKAVGWLIDHANDWACDAGFDAIATLACQAAGLGPLDPWSDICTGVLIAGCDIILSDIEHHITSHKTICKAIHLC